MAKIAVIALAVILVVFLISSQSVEATGGYRKPPFNGSIFGKRNSEGGGVGNGDNYVGSGPGGKSLSSLCEIAWETCSALYLESSR